MIFLVGCTEPTATEEIEPGVSSEISEPQSSTPKQSSSNVNQTSSNTQNARSQATTENSSAANQQSSESQNSDAHSSNESNEERYSFTYGDTKETEQEAVDYTALEHYSLDGGWQLVWQDEFDGDELDESSWNIEELPAGWVNDESQRYTGGHDQEDSNLWVDGGKLYIEARRESNGEITSGRMQSRNKKNWLYGKFEARAIMPGGNGTWPAIWAMANEEGYGRWPQSGEIDIVEFLGKDPEKVHFTIHCDTYAHSKGTQKEATKTVQNLSSEFHTFGLEWTPDEIRGYVDGEQYYSFENENSGWQAWPFDTPFYWILNVAIGGWGGDIDESIFPAQMVVDYVRVWQQKEDVVVEDKNTLSLSSVQDFAMITDRDYVPYDSDNSNGVLSVDPDVYPNETSAAYTQFKGEAGTYSITITTLLENDGEPTYSLFVDGIKIGSYTNPESEGGFKTHTFTWDSIALTDESYIVIAFDNHSNGKIIRDDGSADWAKGRWTGLDIKQVD